MPPVVLWWLVACPVLLTLLLFNARRLLLTATLWRRQPPIPAAEDFPTMLVMVPVRDDAPCLPDLAAALDQLDYPESRLEIVLIDDGSLDESAEVIPQLAAERRSWHSLRIDCSVGKAEALNIALAAHKFGEIVFIFDADHRPSPDCLRIAVRAFADPEVAGVNGRMLITNPFASAVTYYAAIESMVHQLITVRGKDVLDLAPPLLGSNTGYRRSALEAVGGYRRGAFLEDGDLTLALHRAGHRSRFVPAAVSRHTAPPTVRGYLAQHVRWGRGFNDVASWHLRRLVRDRRLRPLLRLELVTFSLGYLDRLAVLAAVALTAVPVLRPVMLAGLGAALVPPLLQAGCVLGRVHAPPAMWWRLPLLLPLFILDVVAAMAATILTLAGADRRWGATERG